MSLVMMTPPAAEPVSVAEAKEFLRVDGSNEDVLIASLLLTSRLHVEAALSIALISQSWTLVLDLWPDAPAVEIPLSPVQSVASVRVMNASGSAVTVPAESYAVDISSRPGRVIWKNGRALQPGVSAGGIEIDFTAGFGNAASVPAPLKHAILMLTAHWYEHRDPQEIGSEGARIPDAVSDLIKPFRTIRL